MSESWEHVGLLRDDQVPELKHCPWCARSLPLKAFARDDNRADGRRAKCKACEAGKRPRRGPRELYCDEGRKVVSKRNPWVESHRRAAFRARKAVTRAIASGKLTAKPCEYRFTGCVKWPTEAHHLSYELGRELDVRWACKCCHDSLTYGIPR